MISSFNTLYKYINPCSVKNWGGSRLWGTISMHGTIWRSSSPRGSRGGGTWSWWVSSCLKGWDMSSSGVLFSASSERGVYFCWILLVIFIIKLLGFPSKFPLKIRSFSFKKFANFDVFSMKFSTSFSFDKNCMY